MLKTLETEFLFVYGTLLQQHNKFTLYLNMHCSFYNKGQIKGRLYDIGEYPGLIVDNNAGYVYGNIYKIGNPEILRELDIYEGNGPEEEQPNLYIRQKHLIETDNDTVKAWLYHYNLPIENLKQITSGNYGEYMRQKKRPPGN
ncbi:gamma-glutamylcyclotransferase family protein [Mucilaginibacter segetis]|uniref:Gamma-glutamylcyclotransferase n=1 Tax=Mucilaginibacter segetis TaxID=2793071 RepID=A0A934UMH2_9SPHI|nr:gamma-glutamylcyclotransferase family protein [Mucilaginibacter segetis]MBK0379030.1 gamma-glutamylcyclotransferase [Mucilaginibacter segetis]